MNWKILQDDQHGLRAMHQITDSYISKISHILNSSSNHFLAGFLKVNADLS